MFSQINIKMNTPIQKERYLFVRYNDNLYFDKYFRANYIDIVRKHLRVYDYEDTITHLNRGNYLHIMPSQWIKSIYKLEDIIGDSVLPLDIVRLIDNFW
jgi:hypothetical protein